jgi:single-stranded DNA-binding protein
MELIQIIGNLGIDATFKDDEHNTLIKLSVATSNRVKNSNNEYEDITTWYSGSIRVSKKRAEYLKTKLIKGAKVFINGELVQEFFYNDKGEKKIRNHIFIANLEAF